jgi:hypothetical protein
MINKQILLGLMAFALAAGAAVPAQAAEEGYRDQPAPLPGWTHTQTFQDDTAQKHGIVLSGGDIVRSSPVIAEMDGNAGNGKEVAVAGKDGRLYVYRANGALAWSTQVTPGCALADGDGVVNSSPAAANLFGDGTPYVLVTYGTIQPSGCDGGLAVYRGDNGQQAWRFSLRNFASTQGYTENLYGALSSPAVADTDGDGRMEIGFGGFDRNLYLLNADGSLRWYAHMADTIWSTPAFFDINGDRRLEMIVGSDISANGAIGTPDGGYVYAMNTANRAAKRIEFCAPAFPGTCDRSYILWRAEFDQAIYSSPVIADVLPGNAGAEAVIGASCFFPTNSSAKRGRWLKILRLSDGALLQTLNAPGCIQSSAAVGDVDGDGQLEVAATVNGATEVGGDGRSRVALWKPSNPTPIWSAAPINPDPAGFGPFNDPYGGDLQSPVIADLDGNGSLEVIAANWWSVHVFNGANGAALTCQGNNCGSQIAMRTWKTVKSTPAVGDINNDGKLDLVIGSGNVFNGSQGQLYAWTEFGRLGSPGGNQPASSTPWPMFGGNARHTGVASAGGSGSLLVTPLTKVMLLRPQTSADVLININSDSGVQGKWTLSESSDPGNIVSLPTASGALGSPVAVRLTAPGNLGSYDATIRVESAGLGAQTVAVKVIVVRTVNTIQLPLVMR